MLTVVAIGVQLATLIATGSYSLTNFFSFFTIQSNLLAAGVLALAALQPAAPLDWWRGLAVTCMVIVGVVFNLLLRSEDGGLVPWVNLVVHVVMPIVVAVDWIAVPPLRPIAPMSAARWLLFPLLWLAYTLARGARHGWYPYPFLNVPRLGAGIVAAYCGAICLGFIVTAAAVVVVAHRRVPAAA